ncbi:MAG TPA: class I SAM-dependent methyltransferase [Solirubrobacteraceae bacterium]|nr:class I SAM-dependent methyltransferase [Solirubrobacteraceae bacterium]
MTGAARLDDAADLRAEVAGREWYHTLELAPGVITPGWFDLRAVAAKVPLPASLAGMRCLDVGTFDGFWAFEMERRGAAEVVAVDVNDPRAWDWPPGSDPQVVAALAARKREGAGFALAHRALGSRVRLVERSVYELDPAELGRFDLVYLGSLLLHLRDPVLALDRVRRVCAGRLLLVDTVEATLSLMFPRRPVARLDGAGRPWWWQANVAGLVRMVEAAGFRVLTGPRLIRFRRGPGQPIPRPTRALATSRTARRDLAVALLGDPHAAILAAPA